MIQFGHVIPENKPTDSLAQKFSEKIRKDIVVCLDEVDKIKDDRILQTLSVQECGLVLITNRPFLLDSTDDRLRSGLFLAEVEFPQYRQSELVSIMKDRIQYSLKPESVPQRLIELIAVWSKGDARVALQTIRAAEMNAESKRHEQISIDDLKEAFKSARQCKCDYVKSKLNEHEKFLLELIEKRRKIASGELFKEYANSFQQPLGERAYRIQMEHLVQTGLVKDVGEGRWKKYELVR